MVVPLTKHSAHLAEITLQPIVVGLIGGIASGKSTVARMLAAHGALWLDSDRMAHEVLDKPDVRPQLVQLFGDEVIDAHGRVMRAVIARQVFGESQRAQELLHQLEQLVHPRVRQRTEERIASEGADYPMVIIDAPLLLEAGWGPRCDRILFVDTPAAVRQQLAAARGWTAVELARREAAQMPLAEKRRQASDILVNDGDLDQLQKKVDAFWDNLLTRPARQ